MGVGSMPSADRLEDDERPSRIEQDISRTDGLNPMQGPLEVVQNGHSMVMKRPVTNSNKEMSVLSDFPIPPDCFPYTSAQPFVTPVNQSVEKITTKMESGKLLVAVIGAGASGLAATKACWEHGLEPVCFESKDDVGGQWAYSEVVQNGYSTNMKRTVTSFSKEMSAFSDFPMPPHFPNFMNNIDVYEYLSFYTLTWGLRKYIRFGVEVTEIKRADDYEETGKWTVISRGRGNTKKMITTETFDAVFVCSGRCGEKHMPFLPGLMRFQRRMMHAHDYHPHAYFDNKKILIVDMENSAGDLAVELSRKAKQVYLSTKRGSWIIQLHMTQGLPPDVYLTTRFEHWQNTVLPSFWADAKFAARTNRCIDHDLYSMTPETGHAPFVSDELIGRMACGSVKLTSDVEFFTREGVKFTDDSYLDIDVVIMVTGHLVKFPFVNEEALHITGNKVELYKHMFLPDLPHQTLAFIGCLQPNGCTWPISELQSRLAVGVLTKKIKLPSQAAMKKDIQEQLAKRAVGFPDTPRHPIKVDYMTTMEELAQMVGCKPNIRRLLWKDPELAFALVFGPCVSAQYRLHGPGRWRGARQIIMYAMDRVRYPLRTRTLQADWKWILNKLAGWILFPPALWTLFLEVLVAVLLLLTLLS